jgi:hypothetical protein
MPRGELVFSSNFECGNLEAATRLSKHEWELQLRPDTNNERHRLWFYFKVRNTARNQKVLFSIVNFSKGRSSFRDGMAPVVRSTHRPVWQRLASQNCLYYRQPRKPCGGGYCLSFFFQFDQPGEEYSFAYCFPYSYTDLQRYLFRLERRCAASYLQRSLLCRTPQHRRVDLLRITNPAVDDRAKRVVVLTARIHPGETPAQFIMQGMLDFLCSPLDPRKSGPGLFACFVHGAGEKGIPLGCCYSTG